MVCPSLKGSAFLLAALVFTGVVVGAEEPIVSRILFGSCMKQDHAAPIFETILARDPDAFIFLGDNIYADTEDMDTMAAEYAKLNSNKAFAELTRSCPVFATWDDHDYGVNDGGAAYPKREEAQRVFLDFWREPDDSPRRKRRGIYDSIVLGPEGKRVQIILLDTRYFRGPLKTGERRVGGPYYPEENPEVTMLGGDQWSWLEEQLRQPAEVRIIASSIQFIAEAAGQETWSNLPRERQRLIDLIARTGAKGVVFISGDRHWAELSAQVVDVPYPIYDLTSSSFNQVHSRGTPTTNRHRVIPKTYHRENFGEIHIDWEKSPREVQLRVLDLKGEVRIEKAIEVGDLEAFCGVTDFFRAGEVLRAQRGSSPGG